MSTLHGRMISSRGQLSTKRRMPPVAALFGLSMGGVTSAEKKAQLLETLEPLQLGASATDDDRKLVESLARGLERSNPTKKPLTSELLNGQWQLLYTTSESILGLRRPAFLRPRGPIYQTLDNVRLKARNDEGPPLFNAVRASLIPESDTKVMVQFTEFLLGGFIPVKAPPSARGELQITYLDEDLRVSRGNKGNLFILKMNNRKNTKI